MSAATPQYGSLSLAVTLAASLAANNVIVAFVAGESNRSRLYMPFNNTLVPQAGDAASKWLPKVGTITTVTDPAGGGQIGEYVITIVPGTADTVNVASVQTIRCDADSVFITATGTW
jgi:hypothetical protein